MHVSGGFDEVLERARSGDETAFAVLFRSVQPALLRYLAAMAGPLAEDVAAETWVRVVADVGRFHGDEDGFRSWVFTIARHRWVDAVRAQSRRPQAAFGGDQSLLSLSAGDDVFAQVDEAVSTERALALVRMLPPDQAEVVLLRVVAGLDVERTAQVLGKKPGAVRVLAHRGLKRLASVLADVGVPERR